MGKIVIYSSATGGTIVQKNTEALSNMLKAKKANAALVYLDVDKTDQQKVWTKSNTKGVYPLLFIDDNFIGTWETVQEMNEEETLDAKLK